MKLTVFVTPRAEVQIREIQEWWWENRREAPELFTEEFEGALDLLETSPDIGQPYRGTKVRGVRRLLLTGSRNHVYYVHDPDRSKVVIIAVWGAVRGKRPPLRGL